MLARTSPIDSGVKTNFKKERDAINQGYIIRSFIIKDVVQFFYTRLDVKKTPPRDKIGPKYKVNFTVSQT